VLPQSRSDRTSAFGRTRPWGASAISRSLSVVSHPLKYAGTQIFQNLSLPRIEHHPCIRGEISTRFWPERQITRTGWVEVKRHSSTTSPSTAKSCSEVRSAGPGCKKTDAAPTRGVDVLHTPY